MSALPLAPAYDRAIKRSLILQILTTIVLLTILDGGQLARAGGAAMLAFWIGVAVIMLRRPQTPSPLDLLYVRWGYLPLLAVAVALARSPWMGIPRT
jgi:hypothetical protein